MEKTHPDLTPLAMHRYYQSALAEVSALKKRPQGSGEACGTLQLPPRGDSADGSALPRS